MQRGWAGQAREHEMFSRHLFTVLSNRTDGTPHRLVRNGRHKDGVHGEGYTLSTHQRPVRPKPIQQQLVLEVRDVSATYESVKRSSPSPAFFSDGSHHVDTVSLTTPCVINKKNRAQQSQQHTGDPPSVKSCSHHRLSRKCPESAVHVSVFGSSETEAERIKFEKFQT